MLTMTINPQGELIARRRDELGISQNALAKMIGKSHTAIWNVENGVSQFTNDETIRAVAEALELHPDALYAAGKMIPRDIEAAITALDVEGLAALRRFLGMEGGGEG